MQNSWNLFKKSVAIVTDNVGDAFRISGAIFVAAVFASTALNVMLTGDLIVEPPKLQVADPNADQTQQIGAAFADQKILALLGGNLIFFIAMSWIAIAWHRFVLLEETPRQLFPSWSGSRVIAYALKTLGIILVIAFVIIIPFALISSIFMAMGLGVMVFFANLLLFVCFYYLFFRAGLVLPALSLDSKMPVRQSLEATKPLSNDIFGLSAIVVGLVLVGGIVIGSIAPNNLIGVLITSVFQWFVVMISASLLTTLYGHTIEHRPL